MATQANISEGSQKDRSYGDSGEHRVLIDATQFDAEPAATNCGATGQISLRCTRKATQTRIVEGFPIAGTTAW